MINLFKAQLLTLIFSWALALCFIIMGGSLYSFAFVPFVFFYSWIPGLVALYFYKLEKMRIPLLFNWNSSYVWAALMPIALGAFTLVLSLPFCEMRSIDYLRSILPRFLSHFTPFTMLFLFVFLGLVISIVGGFTAYLAVSLGHELMWRGYMWDKIKEIGFWKSSLIMGFFWGFWQAPLVLLGYNYPERPFLGIFWLIFYSINISPLLLYYRLKCRSIVGSAVFNGTFCCLTSMAVYLFKSTNALLVGTSGVTGFIACILFNLLLFVKVRKNPLLEYEI